MKSVEHSLLPHPRKSLEKWWNGRPKSLTNYICRGRPWCQGSTLETCGANPEKIPGNPPKPVTDYENNVFIVFLNNI
jgi:hypothetical protein